MRSGVKKRVAPQVRSEAPTSPASSTVTSKPRSSAPIAAARPIGPAPTTTRRRAPSALPRDGVAPLPPVRDRASAANHRRDVDRLRHLLGRDAAVGAGAGVGVDAVRLLN